MKIFVSATSFLKPQNAPAKAALEAYFDEIVYNERGVPLRGEEIIDRLRGCDAYLAGLDYLTADVIARMPESLRVISRYGVGTDRVDLPAARARGIVVTNTPGANSTSVCELAFGLVLCAARDIPRLHEAVTRGEWPRGEGVELAGKTLGIVGMGAIGKLLAVRARAFEMKVLAYDSYFDEDFAAAQGVKGAALDELLEGAEFISLHLPLTDATRRLISRERIARMRPGTILINTARGGLIDEAAAAEALKSGRLGGLGLDAFEQEPPTDSPLKGLPNVIFTPHAGAHTAAATRRMAIMAAENAIAVLKGEKCRYIVK